MKLEILIGKIQSYSTPLVWFLSSTKAVSCCLRSGVDQQRTQQESTEKCV